MVKRALLLIALAAGCYDDRYRCTESSQCDLGEGGRCETDGYCTHHDITCPTQRRYSAHAGALTDQCYDGRITPVNACAGGQPPAKPEGCFADVCDALPACCEVAWTDACAQLAEHACDTACDTRIAITAVRGTTTEHWDARWDGASWTFQPRTDIASFGWVGPAPGTREPRLATASDGNLLVGDTALPVAAGRTYESFTSVDFDRDGRDTIAAAYTDASNARVLELWKLDTMTMRDTRVPGTSLLAWGDENRDAFPDGIIKSGSTGYSYLDNLEETDFTRKVSNQTTANVSGGATPGAPQVRSFDWLDLDGDKKLDLVVFGASVRVHTNPDGLRDVAEREIDCDPPSATRACAADPEPNLEQASFAGAALSLPSLPSFVIAIYPGRKLYRVWPNGSIDPLAFPGDSCSCTPTCTSCPGVACSCTYNCNTCVPVLALVARDLDHDHAIDLIAIDARLQIYVAKASNGFQFGGPTAIPTAFPNTFFSVDTSVTGAPIP